MAKYKHTKVTTDKLQIEGVLNTETMTIDVDGQTIDINKELSIFDGKSISMTFVEKTEEDLDDLDE